MEKSLFIKTTGEQIEVFPENKKDFSLKELQGYVGGYIELVSLSKTRMMVLNEEGKLNNLPVNPDATKLFHKAYPAAFDFIVGNVLVCDKNLVK